MSDPFAELREAFQEAMKNRPPPPVPSQDIEHCCCTWPDFEGGMAECGCGRAHIRIYRDDDTFHFEGKHWSSTCLISELLQRLGLPGFAGPEKPLTAAPAAS